jgi:hypothetical protein
VLWVAGQKRVAREGRERLAELFVGVRDGYLAAEGYIGDRIKMRGGGIPAYARGEAPTQSIEAQRATFARLARMFPGAIQRRSS